MIRQPTDMTTEIREDMRGGTGKVSIQHLFKKDDITANCRLCSRLTLPPGTSIGTHEHAKEDELFVIISGTGILDDGTTQTPVGPGDAILTGNGEAHAIANSGDTNLDVIAIIMCY